MPLRTITAYPVPVKEIVAAEVRAGAEALDVGITGGRPCVFMLEDPVAPRETRLFLALEADRQCHWPDGMIYRGAVNAEIGQVRRALFLFEITGPLSGAVAGDRVAFDELERYVGERRGVLIP